MTATPGGRRAARPAWLPLVVGVAFWLALPIACLAALGVGSARLAGHIDAGPDGVAGTYAVSAHTCQRQLCVTIGTFTSDNGQMTVTGLLGDYRWRPGIDYRVAYSSNAADVVSLPGDWDPTSTVLGLGAAVMCLAGWGLIARTELRRRRSSV